MKLIAENKSLSKLTGFGSVQISARIRMDPDPFQKLGYGSWIR